MSSVGSISQSTISSNIASLPKYNVSNFRDLPANAAAEGVFANGDVYYDAYAELTSTDKGLVESITGEKSVQGDPLAGAIGTDRAHAAIGWAGGLTGDVTVSYLESIETALANAHSGGTYDGFQVSSKELSAAIDYVAAKDEAAGTTSNISVSA